MPQKIYKKVGLKRDNNFTDLSNPTDALNNLIGGIVDTLNVDTFISQDLDCIRGIYSAGLDNSEYSKIVGSSVKFTNSSGATEAVTPRITYQNRLDKFRLFSGEPRFNGGNGLTASYFNKNQIFENTVGIFSGTPFKTDNFWEFGNFTYSGKITPESADANGGVLWEGYFIPTVSGTHTFYINSSACFTFDFETQGYTSGVGTYTEIARIGLTSSLSASGTLGSNQITLTTPSDTKYVGVGQSVSGVGIYTGSLVESIDKTTGVVVLTPPTATPAVTVGFTNQNKTFSKAIGQQTEITHSTYILSARQKYRVRARYYIPSNINALLVERSIGFDFSGPNIGRTELRYTSLYSLNYDFSDAAKGEFPIFVDNSIGFGGGTIGGLLSQNYIKVKSSKKVDIKYQPKTSINDIIKLTIRGAATVGSNVVSITNTSGLESGNYVYSGLNIYSSEGVLISTSSSPTIPDGTTIQDILFNNSIILSANAIATGYVDLTFVEHRGFVKRAVGSGSLGSFTLSGGNITNLKSGMIMIGPGVSAYTRIKNLSSVNFEFEPSQTIGAGTTVYFYQSRGLINDSLNSFCIASETKCITVASRAEIGATVISVLSNEGVPNGSSVQGSYFKNGTKVSTSTATSITITEPLDRALVEGANFTVTTKNEDRQLCCPPTDTSPPFNATSDGLETIYTGLTPAPSLRIESGNVIFSALTAVVSPSNITTYSPSDTSTSRLSIQTPIGTYKILCA